ncbi:MAG: hypothetical protein M1830_004381 [Pleopsidium flavum]|nr:MAG: hypothetical protein M1830_004381 [Pleopsidium flavum]
MGYYELAREARMQVRRGTGEDKRMWKVRLEDLGIRVGNALVEMGDLKGAARHLQTLRGHESGTEEDRSMHSRLALLYLRLGDVAAAKEHAEQSHENLAGTTTSSILPPLLSMAEGQYDAAVTEWTELRTTCSEQDNAMITQNLAVCLLYTGRLNEARKLLESLVEEGHSFHSLTFNLSTIYELCTEKARALKLDLTEKMAAQSESGAGWEKTNGDFKL